MLDQLRRHAASPLIKTALAVIIVSFTLFFGYQTFENEELQRQNYAAIVGDDIVPRARFEATYENAVDRMRAELKDKAPPDLEKILRSTVLNELIGQVVAAQFARSLGFQVSAGRLSERILKTPGLAGPGGFDYEAYHRVYRPSFQRRMGEDFEKVIEREILQEDLEQLALLSLEPWRKTVEGLPTAEEYLASWLRQYQQGLESEILVRP